MSDYKGIKIRVLLEMLLIEITKIEIRTELFLLIIIRFLTGELKSDLNTKKTLNRPVNLQ